MSDAWPTVKSLLQGLAGLFLYALLILGLAKFIHFGMGEDDDDHHAP